MSEPIRIFIGTEPKTELMRYVLQHSIQENTPRQIEFIPMLGKEWEYELGNIPFGTGFSFRRWMIPERCGWQGKAIYLDADQLVLGDIGELWDCCPGIVDAHEAMLTEDDKAIETVMNRCAWMTQQRMPWSTEPIFNSSVMVIDCEKAKLQDGWHLDRVFDIFRAFHRPITQSEYRRYMYPDWMQPAPGIISNVWNSLDTYTERKTKLLHYTDEPNQPPYNPQARHARLWQHALCRAIKADSVPKDVFDEAVRLWSAPRIDHRTKQGLHPSYHGFWTTCRE